MTNSFIVYRQGSEAFRLESRKQGEVRKVTQAVFSEEIMTDDSIKMTIVSSVLMDFHLRDYIVYESRPYLLNQIPEASIDSARRYTYNVVFEGAMYELGRVAFILSDAFGYDYYGTLPEFARLVVDNMNRVNIWVEWDFVRNDNITHHKARIFDKIEQVWAEDQHLLYRWGNGFNSELEGWGESWIFTDGVPSVGDHAIDAYSSFSVDDTITVTAVHQWSFDFPKTKKIPAQYAPPPVHMPEDEFSTQWKVVIENTSPSSPVIRRYTTERNYSETIDGYEYQHTFELFSNIFYGDVPQSSKPSPDSPTDVEEYKQKYWFTVKETVRKIISVGNHPIVSESTEGIVLYRSYTYMAQVTTNWQVYPVTPPSGGEDNVDEATESRLLSYDSASCLAVLQDLSDKWVDWEWCVNDMQYDYVGGKTVVCGTIVMRKRSRETDETIQGVNHLLGFGRRGGLLSIRRKYADDSNIPSRIYFYGGMQNLPEYYRNTRLCLPNMTKENSYIDFSELLASDNQDSDYLFPLGVSNEVCEEVKVFDEIYPANEPFTIKDTWELPAIIVNEITGKSFLQLGIPKGEFFDITGKWKYFQQQSPPYPDYQEWLKMKQYVETQENESDLHAQYTNYYAGHSKYLNGADTPMFTFQSGDLAGYSLSVHKFYEDNNMYYIELNVVSESNEEISDYHVPNTDICCNYGDKFIVENINMPVSYTYYDDGSSNDFSAENALLKASYDYMNETAAKIDYEVEVSREYVVKNGDKFNIFDTLSFNDPLTGGTENKRIIAVEHDMIDGYKYKLTVTNRRIRTMQVLHASDITNNINER